MTNTLLIFLLALISGSLATYLILTKKGAKNPNNDVLQKTIFDSISSLNQNINNTLLKTVEQMDKRIAENTNQVTESLGKNVKAIDESKSFITDRVSQTEKTVREVTNQLSKLEEASSKLLITNKEIVSFQNMLIAPKMRGGFGESLLENMLRDVLPHDKFQTQYTFKKTGEICDAVIFLLDNKIVGIDSKFPLANFEKYFNEKDELIKENSYKEFIRDVKKRIDEISSKYVSPQDNTLNFAMMYIPMESIYYDIVVKRDGNSDNIWEYAHKKRVIPVSPNSITSYIFTILEGLKGYEVEQKAGEILKTISQLRTDFSRVSEDFDVLGKHLNNAKAKYDDTTRRFDKMATKIESIDENEQLKID